MINIKKTIHSITVKNGLLYDFGEKMHEEISNFLAPYIINNEELTDEKINQEIIAVKHVMDALQSHPDLIFSSENYFEVVFDIKETALSLTLNFPFNVIERGSPAYFEYKIRTEEDFFLAEYLGSWQKNGVILSIREKLCELEFENTKIFESIRSAYAKSINAVYNSKSESELQSKLLDVFDVFSDALEQTKSIFFDLEQDELPALAHTFYQICSFVFENKDLMKFSNEHFPIYVNSDGKLSFHNIVENQSLSFDVDYNLDSDANLSTEERRQKIINDSILYLSEGENFENELLKFSPLNTTTNKSKGGIEETEDITFSELIFLLCCYIIWQKRIGGDNFITPEVVNRIFDVLKKSEHFEFVDILGNDKNAYFKIKNKNLAIIISLDEPLENTFQTYHRLFSLLDRNFDINSITIKQRYSIPFEKLPFTIFLVEEVSKIDYNTSYNVEPIFKKISSLVENFNHEIKSNLEEIDPQLHEISLLIQDVFTIGTSNKLKNMHPQEIAYKLVKFSEIIKEETNFKLDINKDIFLKTTDDNFVLSNPICNIK